MEMGRQSPDRIRAMVLSNANAEGPAQDERPVARNVSPRQRQIWLRTRYWVTKVISAKNAQDARLVGSIRQMVEDCRPDVHERQNRAFIFSPDATTNLSTFDFPVLLMTGARPPVDAEIAKPWSSKMQGIVCLEQPQLVSTVGKDLLFRKFASRPAGCLFSTCEEAA